MQLMLAGSGAVGGGLPSLLPIYDFTKSTELYPLNTMYKYMDIDFGDINQPYVNQVFNSYNGVQICAIYPNTWSNTQESQIYETYMSGGSMYIRNPFLYSPISNELMNFSGNFKGGYIRRFIIDMENSRAEYWNSDGSKSAMPVSIMTNYLISIYFSDRIDFGGQPAIFQNMKISLCKEYPT